ncbi:MAG: hypothetical protein JXR68_09245 [Bacteroidales bacterium]|nr:hypothetical protein [Bacteroidales bacterium]
MKEFTEEFKTKLYQTIQEIENNSLVEVVTIIRQQSQKYTDVALKVAAVFTVILFSVLIFIPFDISTSVLHLLPILSFMAVFYVVMSIPMLLRLFISQKRIDKSVEIMGRAIFQKGGIRFTEQRIGILIFISYFEKKVFIVADRGVHLAVPKEDLDNLENRFNNIFENKSVADEFLKELSSCKDVFSQYIPPVENDINELPDNLVVDL